MFFYKITSMREVRKDEIWGLALSGGGARGAYQYGAWRALQDTPLIDRFQVIGGTSIGAINAVLFSQEQLTGEPVARKFWEELDLSYIFAALPEGTRELGVVDYLRLSWDGIQNLGIRIDPLKDWLRANLKPEVLKDSDQIVWANTWDLFKFREEIRRYPGSDPNAFVEWVLGSASFPFFGPHQYQGRYLLDGGIANNLPLHLVFQESTVQQVLAIDLATFMRYHPRQLMLERKYGHQTHFLRVGLDLPSPASFSRSSIDQMIDRGRADARAWWEQGCTVAAARDTD